MFYIPSVIHRGVIHGGNFEYKMFTQQAPTSYHRRPTDVLEHANNKCLLVGALLHGRYHYRNSFAYVRSLSMPIHADCQTLCCAVVKRIDDSLLLKYDDIHFIELVAIPAPWHRNTGI